MPPIAVVARRARGGAIEADHDDDARRRSTEPSAGAPQELRAAWRRLTGGLGADDLAAAGVLDDLDGRYREAHRAYHTWSHIRHVHDVMRWMTVRMVAPEPAIELAVFFHDAVYDPHAPADATTLDNETASADLARTACGLMALPDDLGATVHRLVLSTRDHLPADRDEAVLCDADLAILASDPATYDVYRRAVRVEYGHLDDVTFRRGRRRVLERLLDRERIYATPLMHDRAESAARRNIRRELDGLGG